LAARIQPLIVSPILQNPVEKVENALDITSECADVECPTGLGGSRSSISMARTALIVDDSASARLALGRVLAEQDLAVDTAASGEEALEYLRQGRPDVIFMDHLMPGMDGFQALEAIKDNPATATIPVMMYTSQEGELYVGQARALGAFGVLPKQVQPVEVTEVLRALHLVPEAPEDLADAEVPTRDIDSGRVSELLEELFHQQRSVLREEIRKGYERLAETTSQTKQPPVQRWSTGFRSTTLSVGAMVLALAVLVFAYLYFETSALLIGAQERVALLGRTAEQNAAVSGPSAVEARSAGVEIGQLLGLLEWAANQGGSYGFGEIALDAERARVFGMVADQLRHVGFRGTVAVDVHVGRYCMNLAVEGGLVLPAEVQPLEQCQQLGWPEPEALSLGGRQTLPFANALALASRGEGIEFEIISHGATQPLVPYPAFAQGLTAGEWNDVAALNQRVEVRIVPE